MVKNLNDTQLQLFSKYLSTTIQNNQEIHPSDMPPTAIMFKLLADQGYIVTERQIDESCNSLHSLSDQTTPTSKELEAYLNEMASVFENYARQLERGQHYKRSFTLIANDIISENDVEYSEAS